MPPAHARRFALPVSRPFLLAAAAGLAAGAVTMLPDAATGPGATAMRPAAEVAAASLVDDGGAALFTETDLAPGRLVTRCLAVDYAGTPGAVRLVADDLTGTLAPYLRFTVRAGTGGGSGSCAGFAGDTVYDGTLTGLSGGSADAPGVAAGQHPGGSRTYAISVRVDDDNDAQGRAAGATLRWLVVPDPEPGTETPVIETPVIETPATEAPAPDRPARSPGAVRTPARPGAPTGTVTAPAMPVPGDSATPSPGAVPGPAGDRTGGATDRPLLRRVLEGVVKVLAAGSRHAAIPLLAVLVMLLFLAVQDRIDGHDPKLALAPLTRDRFLTFDDDDAGPRTGRPEEHR